MGSSCRWTHDLGTSSERGVGNPTGRGALGDDPLAVLFCGVRPREGGRSDVTEPPSHRAAVFLTCLEHDVTVRGASHEDPHHRCIGPSHVDRHPPHDGPGNRMLVPYSYSSSVPCRCSRGGTTHTSWTARPSEEPIGRAQVLEGTVTEKRELRHERSYSL